MGGFRGWMSFLPPTVGDKALKRRKGSKANQCLGLILSLTTAGLYCCSLYANERMKFILKYLESVD